MNGKGENMLAIDRLVLNNDMTYTYEDVMLSYKSDNDGSVTISIPLTYFLQNLYSEQKIDNLLTNYIDIVESLAKKIAYDDVYNEKGEIYSDSVTNTLKKSMGNDSYILTPMILGRLIMLISDDLDNNEESSGLNDAVNELTYFLSLITHLEDNSSVDLGNMRIIWSLV